MKEKIKLHDKVKLFEKYLNEGNTPDSITAETVYEGYEIGFMLSQIRYNIRRGRYKKSKEDIEKLEEFGLLEPKHESSLNEKVDRLNNFCKKHLELWLIRNDKKKVEEYLTKVERTSKLMEELEQVRKDYAYISVINAKDARCETKLVSKRTKTKLKECGVGGIFGYPKKIEEAAKCNIADPKIYKKLCDFLLLQSAIYKGIENFYQAYIEKVVQDGEFEMPKDIKTLFIRYIDLSSPNFINMEYAKFIDEFSKDEKIEEPIILFYSDDIERAFQTLTKPQRKLIKSIYGITKNNDNEGTRQAKSEVRIYALRKLKEPENKALILKSNYDQETVQKFLKKYIELEGIFVNQNQKINEEARRELLAIIRGKEKEGKFTRINEIEEIDNTIRRVNEEIQNIDGSSINDVYIERLNLTTSEEEMLKAGGVKTIGDFIGLSKDKIEAIINGSSYTGRMLIAKLNFLGYYYDEQKGKFEYTVLNPEVEREKKSTRNRRKLDSILKNEIQELQQLYIEYAAKYTKIAELEKIIKERLIEVRSRENTKQKIDLIVELNKRLGLLDSEKLAQECNIILTELSNRREEYGR